MEELIKKDESVKDIILDRSIRIDGDGKLFDISDFHESLDN